MGTGAFAHPFRLDPRGQVATVPYGSDDEVDGIIRAMIDTRPGDRAIYDEFGIPEPTFVGVDAGDIQAGLDQFGPAGVDVADVVVEVTGQDTQSAIVSWQWADDEGLEEYEE